jgi:DnaJ-class molecular chaperone
MKDYYAVLGVEADASDSALKSAYRRKASEFHPDRNPSPDAAERFRETQEAYDLLSDPAKRQDYDENRRRSLLENPLATAQDIWKTYMNKVLQ